jgi:ParB/RepB/Spo0J family partition protein
VDSGDSFLSLPLSVIDTDPAWNIRTGDFTQEGYGLDLNGTGFAGLKKSILEEGLKDPLEVQAMTGWTANKGTHTRYRVVAGFRRHRAVRDLYEKGKDIPGLLRGQVLVKLIQPGEKAARKANLRENSQREGVSIPDLAWGVAELAREGADLEECATTIGKSPAYTKNLIRIMTELTPRITSAWRAGKDINGGGFGTQIAVEDMMRLVDYVPHDLRERKYSDFYHNRELVLAGHPSRLKKTRRQNTAVKMGELFARLELEGVIELFAPASLETWSKILFTGKKDDTKDEARDVLAEAALRAYDKTFDRAEKAAGKAKASGGSTSATSGASLESYDLGTLEDEDEEGDDA